jgi:RNA-directed DNA polymerase
LEKDLGKMCKITGSRNHTRTCWVLKCDTKKFFTSIDHEILIGILRSYIPDKGTLGLLKTIIESFEVSRGAGLPLGNLTSQLFCNVYMNVFDQFAKHRLKARRYIRYADDFLFLSESKEDLESMLPRISEFLWSRLKLSLHPEKVCIKSFASGVDFLGWIHFPKYRTLRTVTKKRMVKRVGESPTEATLNSYLGLLRHGDAYSLVEGIKNIYRIEK